MTDATEPAHAAQPAASPDAGATMSAVEFPLPDHRWPPTRPLWDGLHDGRLTMPRCTSCDHWRWYQFERCWTCGDEHPSEWVPVSGRGWIHTFSVVHRAFVPAYEKLSPPYVPAIVTLAEHDSLRIATTILDVEPDRVHVGMPVALTIRDFPWSGGDPVSAPYFTPDDHKNTSVPDPLRIPRFYRKDTP